MRLKFANTRMLTLLFKIRQINLHQPLHNTKMCFFFFLQKILTGSQKNLPHKKIIIFPTYKVVGAKNYPRMYVGNVWTLLTFHDVFINVWRFVQP